MDVVDVVEVNSVGWDGLGVVCVDCASGVMSETLSIDSGSDSTLSRFDEVSPGIVNSRWSC